MDFRIERILEQGLSSYAESEPLAGMEERILARIRRSGRQRRVTSWWVACAVALAVLAAFILPRNDAPRPVEVAVQVRPVAAVPRVEAAISKPQILHRRAQMKALPKLPVFPAPTRLTKEELRLLALVEQDPQGTAEAFQSLQKRNEPIEIVRLEIKPLETGGGQ